jgi:dolichol-phosphate mannosyltransferase
MNKLLIVIPTYNEVQSAPQLIEDLLLLDIDIDFLIVDDGSTDQTVEACQSIDFSKHASVLNILQRGRKLGLASAYIEGFSWAISTNYKFVAQMDADGSHRPVDLALMYATQIHDDKSIVIGSRWTRGGKTEKWSIFRKILSRGGNSYARFMLSLKIRDLTAGFRIYPIEVLKGIPYREITSEGYCFQIEMSKLAVDRGFQIIEIPITFVERAYGQSKMSKKIVIEAIRNVTVWGLSKRLKFGNHSVKPR